MKKFAVLIALITVFITVFTSAQEIKPRRKASTTPAITAPAETPAAEESPVPATDTAGGEQEAPTETEEEVEVPLTDTEKLDNILALTNVTAKGNDLNKLSANLSYVWNSNVWETRRHISHLYREQELVLQAQKRTDRKVKFIFWVLVGIGVLVFFNILVSVIVVRKFNLLVQAIREVVNNNHRDNNDDDHEDDHMNNDSRHTATMVIIGLLGLGAMFMSPSANAACTVRSVGGNGVIVKEQAAAPATLNISNCEVKAIEAGADGVVFSDVVTKGGTVTAKVTATKNAEGGPMGFTLTLADGSKVESPDAVYFLVLDPATAQVREDVFASNAKTSAEVKALETKVKAMPTKAEVQALVDTKVDAKLQSAPTKGQVEALEAKVRDLEQAVASLHAEAAMNAEITAFLLDGQEALATSGVKKSLWGRKRPLNPEIAEATRRVRAVAEEARHNQ